jgi:hypothetical protein
MVLLLVGCGSDDPETPEQPDENGGKTQLDATSSSAPDAAPADAALEEIDASPAEPARDAATPDAATPDAATPDAASDAAIADSAVADAAVDARAPVVDAGPAVKYADVAPILGEYCVSCHSPGGKGPFSLDNYDEASDFGAEAYAAASARIMPPCAAENPSCGPTTAELATLRAWVLQGTPE